MRLSWTEIIGLMFLSLSLSVSSDELIGPSAKSALDEQVTQIIEVAHFPGVALAVTRNGRAIYTASYGFANLEHKVPVAPNTVFELASLTKQMTALAISVLVEDDKLSYDTPIETLLNNIPEEWHGITVNQLLAHMAGFEHHFEPKVNGSHLLENTKEHMLEAAIAMPMRSKPGEDWHYSDLGYFLLGLVIESVVNMDYSDFMHQRFFQAFGMSQTHLLDQRRIVSHRAQGYKWNGNELERNRRVWQFELTPHFGVMSSLKDMIKWENALSNSHHFSQEAIASVTEIQRPFSVGDTCETWGYARGWFSYKTKSTEYVSHGGYAGTAYLRNLTNGLSVIVLTNREDAPNQVNPMAIAWVAMHAFDSNTPKEGLTCWQ